MKLLEKLKLIEAFSTPKTLTEQQFENLINFKYFNELIGSIIDERNSQFRCGFLTCGNESQNSLNKLQSTYSIRNNKVMSNENRRHFCSEKCFKTWNRLRKLIDEHKKCNPKERISLKLLSNILTTNEVYDQVLLIEKLKIDDEDDRSDGSYQKPKKTGPKRLKKKRKTSISDNIQLDELLISWLDTKSQDIADFMDSDDGGSKEKFVIQSLFYLKNYMNG